MFQYIWYHSLTACALCKLFWHAHFQCTCMWANNVYMFMSQTWFMICSSNVWDPFQINPIQTQRRPYMCLYRRRTPAPVCTAAIKGPGQSKRPVPEQGTSNGLTTAGMSHRSLTQGVCGEGTGPLHQSQHMLSPKWACVPCALALLGEKLGEKWPMDGTGNLIHFLAL